MMTCPACGHSETFLVVEVIEQQTKIRCTDKDKYDFIEVEVTLAHVWDTVTCSACGHECDENEGRDAWAAAHSALQEEPP